MEDTYFIIHNGDGDTTIEEVGKAELVKRISNREYGGTEFFNEMPSDKDTNYWGGNILIIKGKIVSPKAVQVVTEFEID